ncbi:hypothetical protein BCR36DRAFT_346546 [Piromyces finnis]|uniref:Uncharacterized protein n=1 Tax=Piromyces finnis TaxID=1754191 RepID=A0A1Y1VI63_9FUNG|nr:hypothetical protein BCR36DRAFT_346546 [Piromyces finnis]|eukprot:ORX56023.1 hypothetical protein BCR36DRAFT_346546 [Piromyces finnis]
MKYKNKYIKPKYLIFRFFILLCFFNINKTVLSEQIPLFKSLKYRKEDIEALPVFICNNKTDCPFYSSGCINVKPATETTKAINICNMSFICHGNLRCKAYESENHNIFHLDDGNAEIGIAFVNKYTYTKSGGENIENKTILQSCNNKLYKKGFCSTENCKNNDTMCYTGVCNNDVCIKKNSIKDYICRVNYNDINNMKIECKLSNQEPCISNEQCDSNICHPLNYCTSSKSIKPLKKIILKQRFKSGLTFLLYFITFLLVIFSIIQISTKYTSKNKDYKKI